MEQIQLFLETFLDSCVGIAIHCFELVGVVIIIVAGIRGVISYIRKDPSVRLQLAQGMALGLEFKLGSEILRTVIVRELTEVALVAAIIAVRAALTFLIHWEIRIEENTENGSGTKKEKPRLGRFVKAAEHGAEQNGEDEA
ncbi:MAG: DUF1622 domain-containing protein [Hominenteromicrobium sp.]